MSNKKGEGPPNAIVRVWRGSPNALFCVLGAREPRWNTDMIKTLRITSVIAAFLAAVVIAFPAFFGAGGDEETEKFLNTPSAVEKFLKDSTRARSKAGKDQISPLTKEAMAFALYLNPPPPQYPRAKRYGTARKGSLISGSPSPKSVSVNFSLIGTSFHSSDPNRSMALINQPGSGDRWVRQNSEVGHLLIEQVKDGSVIVKDGKKSIELTPVRKTYINLLKGASAPSETGQTSISSVLGLPGSTEAGSKSLEQITKEELLETTLSTIPSGPLESGLPQLSSEERQEMMRMREMLFRELSTDLPGIDSDIGGLEELTKATAELMKTAFPGSGPSRIGPEEAKKLDDLGVKLRDTQRLADPNGVRGSKSKIQRGTPRRTRKTK